MIGNQRVVRIVAALAIVALVVTMVAALFGCTATRADVTDDYYQSFWSVR